MDRIDEFNDRFFELGNHVQYSADAEHVPDVQLDSVSQAMNREMDDSYRSQVDQMNRAGVEAVNAMSGSPDEPRERDRESAHNGGVSSRQTTRAEERVERRH